jgi:hypothetical protein
VLPLQEFTDFASDYLGVCGSVDIKYIGFRRILFEIHTFLILQPFADDTIRQP